MLRTFVDGIDHNLNRNRSCSILRLPISLSRFPSWFHLYLEAMPEHRPPPLPPLPATSNLLLPVHIIRIVLADNRTDGRTPRRICSVLWPCYAQTRRRRNERLMRRATLGKEERERGREVRASQDYNVVSRLKVARFLVIAPTRRNYWIRPNRHPCG